MHQEAVGETLHPAQARGIALDSFTVLVSSTVYAGTDFQEVAPRSADIRLLRCALLSRPSRQTSKKDCKQRSNKKVAHISLQSVARFYVRIARGGEGIWPAWLAAAKRASSFSATQYFVAIVQFGPEIEDS